MTMLLETLEDTYATTATEHLDALETMLKELKEQLPI
jgi:hypothetical protein